MKEKSEPIISFHDANIINGENTVVYGLNMDVSGGQTVYILGKVGTGKTSIIRTITAENRLGGGEGIVCGFNLGTLKQKDIPFLRRKIGVVFQDFQLLMDRSIHDNLSFVLKATGWKDGQQMEKRIEEALKSVDMQTKSHKMPHQLSGGEAAGGYFSGADPRAVGERGADSRLCARRAGFSQKIVNFLRKTPETVIMPVSFSWRTALSTRF